MPYQIFIFLTIAIALISSCSNSSYTHTATEIASPPMKFIPQATTAPITATITLTKRLPTVNIPTATPIPTGSLTIKPSTATNTPTIPPTAFPTPTLTSTVLPAARLDIQCLQITTTLPGAETYSGSIILGGYTQTLSYRLDLSTWDMEPLLEGANGKTLFEVVSPDRKWLAYKLYGVEGGIVTKINSQERPIHVPWEKNWGGIKGWLDNQNLQIYIKGGLLVLNPFTGERRELADDFPDLAEPIGIGADWWDVSYNPSLTRAVYQSNPGITDVKGQYGRIILWDMLTNQAMTSFVSENNPYGGEPVWSPAGNEFIMTLEVVDLAKKTLFDELYRVSQDGRQTRLTYLSTYYNKFMSVQKYSWSPDARRIAFWLWYGWEDSLPKNQLAILDLDTLQVTGYCLSGGLSEPPVWSPDAKQLVVERNVRAEDGGTILIDLERNAAFKIAGDFKVAGWMVSP